MAEANNPTTTPGPRKRSRWLRALAFLFVVFIVVLVAVYFVVTSSGFVQKRVLPRVSEALNAEVTVSSAEVHPFSQIVLHDLKVQHTNQPVIFTASGVRLDYSLFDILGGNIHVKQIRVTSPVIQIVENPDGTSNLDALLKGVKKAQGTNGTSKATKSKPPRIDVGEVLISNASVMRIQNHKNGTRDLQELTNVDITVTGVKNGAAGKLQFATIIRVENNPPAPAMYGLLQAKVAGSFNFALGADLNPASIPGRCAAGYFAGGGVVQRVRKADGDVALRLFAAGNQGGGFEFSEGWRSVGRVARERAL